jgi:hypothetical protein
MKKCTKCQKVLAEAEFSFLHPAKMDGKLRPDCKSCVRERIRLRNQNNPISVYDRMKPIRNRAIQQAKDYVQKVLSERACVDCGENDPVVLDFDHVKGDKICDISRMVGCGFRIWKIEKEIAKCEIRCANCHRRVTAKRRLIATVQV